MNRWATRVLAVAALAALAGCATPEPSAQPLIHFANRSNTTLAVAPDLLIAACGTASSTPAAYEASRTQGAKVMMDGTWAVPPGAAFWNGVAFAGDPLDSDVTVVISGTAPLAVRQGVAADADLPACGGAPVGVLDEVVPDPGASDGDAPVVTPLP